MDGVPRWRVGDPAPPPLPRRSEADVVARWQDGPPLVSVLCPTYQHVGFIEDALRGFLGQDTDFPFEVIVRDDASTDGTADIVRDYAERYPSIVRAVLEPMNKYQIEKPFTALRREAGAGLLAMCEGDDYWIRPDKLARQVELLRAHPEVSVVIHPDIDIRDDVVIGVWKFPERQVISAADLRRERVTRMSVRTMCFRSALPPADVWESRIPSGDRFLVARLGELGCGAEIPDIVGAVHRHHAGGIWTSRSRQEQNEMMAVTHFWIADYFTEQGDRRSARFHLTQASLRVANAQLVADVDPRLTLVVRMLLGWPRTVARRTLARLLRRSR